MDFTDLEQSHGNYLARTFMGNVYEREVEVPAPTRDHGGLPINGGFAFKALQHAICLLAATKNTLGALWEGRRYRCKTVPKKTPDIPLCRRVLWITPIAAMKSKNS